MGILSFLKRNLLGNGAPQPTKQELQDARRAEAAKLRPSWAVDPDVEPSKCNDCGLPDNREQDANYAAGNGRYRWQVKGTSNYQAALKAIRGTSTARTLDVWATLESEPGNAYDSNAVSVWINGRLIGYIDREYASRVTTRLEREFPLYSRVACKARILLPSEADHYIGVRLDLPDRWLKLLKSQKPKK